MTSDCSWGHRRGGNHWIPPRSILPIGISGLRHPHAGAKRLWYCGRQLQTAILCALRIIQPNLRIVTKNSSRPHLKLWERDRDEIPRSFPAERATTVPATAGGYLSIIYRLMVTWSTWT